MNGGGSSTSWLVLQAVHTPITIPLPAAVDTSDPELLTLHQSHHHPGASLQCKSSERASAALAIHYADTHSTYHSATPCTLLLLLV